MMATQASGRCGDKAVKDCSDAIAETDEVRQGESGGNCWNWCMDAGSDEKQGGIRFGFLLVLLGLLWLGGAVGRLPENTIWPLTVVLVGFWLAVVSRIRWKRNN